MDVNPLRNLDFRRAGFWGNWLVPGPFLQVGDHEVWVRDPANASHLGIDAKTVDRFKDFPYIHGDAGARSAFLRFVMLSAPVMRIRGHGDHITFEYHAGTDAGAEMARRCADRFCREAGVGKFMGRKIVNLCGLPSGQQSLICGGPAPKSAG